MSFRKVTISWSTELYFEVMQWQASSLGTAYWSRIEMPPEIKEQEAVVAKQKGLPVRRKE